MSILITNPTRSKENIIMTRKKNEGKLLFIVCQMLYFSSLEGTETSNISSRPSTRRTPAKKLISR